MTFHNAAVRPPTGQGERNPFPHTPSQHAELLHPVKAKGQAFVGRKLPPTGKWDQDSCHPWELDAVLYELAGEQDVYLTQNRFKGRRKAASQLRELAALWSDVDFYKLRDLAELAPEAVLEMALKRLERAGIPEPSLTLASGQGLYLVWPHAPVVRKELELHRWRRCQRRLYDVLKDLGADANALPETTLLRLAGTKNGKNGSPVYALRDARPHQRFVELAEQILPVGLGGERERADLHDIRLERIARRGYKAPRHWNAETLWEARLYDLQTLRRLRYGEGLMPDFRDRWLFLAGNAAAWLAHSPEALENDLLALAEEAGGWNHERTRSKLQAVFNRVRMAARGEKLEWMGVEWDPRFHFKNQTIIERLEITQEEERQMLVLIGEDEERRRRTNRKRRERRRRGVRPRVEYDQNRTADVHERIATARQLKDCGLSTAEIAAEMGVSVRTVQRWLR